MGETQTATRDDLLKIARSYDPIAEWASKDADENCLLIAHVPAAAVLERVGDLWGAYEDANPAGAANTRLVFAKMPTFTDRAYARGEEAPDGLEAVEYVVYPASSEEGDGARPRKITLWVGAHPDQGHVNVDAGRERLESEGWQVTDWGAA